MLSDSDLQVVPRSHHCEDPQLQVAQLDAVSLDDDVIGQLQLPETL